MNDIDGLLLKIQRNLKKHGNRNAAEKYKGYHKYDGYVSYGIKAPALSRILKSFKNDIGELGGNEALELAGRLYVSGIEEQVLAGTYVLELHDDYLTPDRLEYLDQMLGYFKSWSTVDDFCLDIMQSLLRKHSKETLLLVKKWNKSDSRWKKRASVVVFTRKIGESGWFTDEALQMCDNLIRDEDDLVRKGVGWALKDLMRGNKGKILDYVKKARANGVFSVVILYAIRDLKGRERREFLRTPTGNTP